jgi:hypothetical protein
MQPDRSDSSKCQVGRAWARLSLTGIHCQGSICIQWGPRWIPPWGNSTQPGKWNRLFQSDFHCHTPDRVDTAYNGLKMKHPCLVNIYPWGTAFKRLPLAHSSNQGCIAYLKGSLQLLRHYRGSLLRKNLLWYQQQNLCNTIQQDIPQLWRSHLGSTCQAHTSSRPVSDCHILRCHPRR